jgi:hypothetical protein
MKAITKEDFKKIAKYYYDTFIKTVKTVRESNEFTQPFEFTVAKKSDIDFEIFIKGTRTQGDEYTLETWKCCPCIRIRYVHGDGWDYHMSYTHCGSEDFSLEALTNGIPEKRCLTSIRNAIIDFTQEVTI